MSPDRAGLVWPRPDERRLVARFYVAVGLSQALYVVFPFEFAYLFLTMRRPEWSVLPLIVASATTLLTQLPTGVLADRWGRKRSVLAGGVLTAVTFVTVPTAVKLPGIWQLYGTCAAFALFGLGDTMMMGAEEAWVVDNLHHAGRADLVEPFFARWFAITGFGTALASGLALTVLLTMHVDQGLLDVLWYATAAGFLAAVAVALTIPEHRPGGGGQAGPADPAGASDPADPPDSAIAVTTATAAAVVAGGTAAGTAAGTAGVAEDDPPLWPRTKQALRALVRTRGLLLLIVAVMVATLSSAGADEAFPVSLLTKGMDARVLGPLGIVDGLAGVGAPLVGMVLARRLGSERLLSVVLVVAGVMVTVLFATQGVWVVLALYVVLGTLDHMWDPVALARVQRDIPSRHRAALGSVMYQAEGLAQVAGLGLFGLLLGSHSQRLREATPDLIEAFSGHSHPPVSAPVGLFGLPVPDVAIVTFVLIGLLAVPFIVLSGHSTRRSTRRKPPAAGDRQGTGDPGTTAIPPVPERAVRPAEPAPSAPAAHRPAPPTPAATPPHMVEASGANAMGRSALWPRAVARPRSSET